MPKKSCSAPSGQALQVKLPDDPDSGPVDTKGTQQRTDRDVPMGQMTHDGNIGCALALPIGHGKQSLVAFT